MADIKSLLREARKLIDDKSFKEAQDCCKNILRKDKQNYLALVLLGKALDDTDQAPLAYQKAIACKPDNPLAWQGLASYYEKKDDFEHKKKLLTVYGEILKLQIDQEKFEEYVYKLCQVAQIIKSSEAINAVLDLIKRNNQDDKLTHQFHITLFEILKSGINPPTESINEILRILEQVKDIHQVGLIYVKILLLREEFVNAFYKIVKSDFFLENAVVKEWFCKYVCKMYIEQNGFSKADMVSDLNTLTSGIENSKAAILLQAIIDFENHQYLEAYKKVASIINYHQPDPIEAILIVRCTLKLKNWSTIHNLAVNFLSKISDNNFRIEFKRSIFISLFKQMKWEQALSVIQDVSADKLTTSELSYLGHCMVKCNQSPDAILALLQNTVYYIYVQAQKLKHDGKYEEVLNLIDNDIQDPYLLTIKGESLYLADKKDEGYICLLKSARLDSENADTFKYLGLYFHKEIQNLEKAKKCYEKAYNLNVYDNEVAKSLSDVYSHLDLKDADFDLLNNLLDKNVNSNEIWIHFRLGLHYLNRRQWESSISSFRNVIKNGYNNQIIFECLADAYFSRGSYTSAMRAYKKVLELSQNKSAHSFTRIGLIHNLFNQYNEALLVFEKAQKIDPINILAIKGKAETWFKIAKAKKSANLFGSARDSAQHAVDSIAEGLLNQRKPTFIWKLVGDILLFITKLPNQYSHVNINMSFKDNEEKRLTQKIEIYPIILACYSQVAKQTGESCNHDLASAYYSYYKTAGDTKLLQRSLNSTIACIKLKPTAWKNWNLLGKIFITLEKYDKAQHCFIKALMVTRKWSVAQVWCNLGILYLKLQEYKLANYCFWRGQSTMPAYPQSWIGQALIAERIREEEAMDLFRHASRLGYHRESALGYADWVCRTLKKHYFETDKDYKYVIQSLHAVPFAINLMEWYTLFEPNDAISLTMLGILQERFGTLNSALKSHTYALKTVNAGNKDKVLQNIGRIYLRLQKYTEAVEVFKTISEASLDQACGLALALLKSKQYEESYSAYDTALHWLTNTDEEKADLLVAMAGIMYVFKGAEDAKTLLFHSIQITQQKPTPHSLFGICSLGLLHKDPSLSKLALAELKKIQYSHKYSFDVGFLKSYLSIVEGDIKKAVKILSDTLHDHPSNPALWYCLAEYCLQNSSMRRCASSCVHRALSLSQYTEVNWDPTKILVLASIAENLSENRLQALKLAKKGIHLYPSQAQLWVVLLFLMISNRDMEFNKLWLAATTQNIKNNFELSPQMRQWFDAFERVL